MQPVSEPDHLLAPAIVACGMSRVVSRGSRHQRWTMPQCDQPREQRLSPHSHQLPSHKHIDPLHHECSWVERLTFEGTDRKSLEASPRESQENPDGSNFADRWNQVRTTSIETSKMVSNCWKDDRASAAPWAQALSAAAAVEARACCARRWTSYRCGPVNPAPAAERSAVAALSNWSAAEAWFWATSTCGRTPSACWRNLICSAGCHSDNGNLNPGSYFK
jgi:hypothetical protein